MPRCPVKNETEFQTLFLKGARRCNATAFNFIGHERQKKGIPDIHIDHGIWQGWLEIKFDDNTYSKEQEKHIKDMKDRAYGMRLNSRLNIITIENHKEQILQTFASPSNKTLDSWRKVFIEIMLWLKERREQVSNGS